MLQNHVILALVLSGAAIGLRLTNPMASVTSTSAIPTVSTDADTAGADTSVPRLGLGDRSLEALVGCTAAMPVALWALHFGRAIENELCDYDDDTVGSRSASPLGISAAIPTVGCASTSTCPPTPPPPPTPFACVSLAAVSTLSPGSMSAS